jgi:hypothetical protein
MAANLMAQFRATAKTHMQRDLNAGRKWTCTCEACDAIRNLVAVDKVLIVRNLVREIQEAEDRWAAEPDGPPKQGLWEHYLRLHDELVDALGE